MAIRSSSACSGSNKRVSAWLVSIRTSTVATSRTSSWSATAETGRLIGSSTLKPIFNSYGISAPRQRRGRKGLIGVSAISLEPRGRIGPLAERL